MVRSLAFSSAIVASLPFLINALSNPFPSPSQGLQCAKAITQLSCHSTYNVDPNGYGTCCYNGALAPGDKESGSILSTQFWNVSTGPADSFTIHGLWPDYCDGTYPQFCTAQSGIPTKSGQEIEEIIQKYDPILLSYMKIYYEDEPSFWEHEYNKHGTCYSTLRAKCQPVSPFINQTSEVVLGYFQQIVHEFKETPSYDWLQQAGIVPSSTEPVKLVDVQNALSAKHGGFTPYVGCYQGQLSELWYFWNVRGPLIHGQYVPAVSTAASNCPAEFIYPPKLTN